MMPAINICKACGDAQWDDRPHECAPAIAPTECDHCDGYGCIWNNADPTSGQWVACDCGDARGHP